MNQQCDRGSRIRPVLWAILLASVAPTSLQAQAGPDASTRAAARELAEAGIDAYLADNFTLAEEKLERAYALFPTPTLCLWSARTQVKLGRLVEAAERYRETLLATDNVGNSSVQKNAKSEAAQELEALKARIPAITINVEGADLNAVHVTLDGAKVPKALLGTRRPTNPGKHVVVATLGRDSIESKVDLAEREDKPVRISFKPEMQAVVPAAEPMAQPVAAPAAPSPQTTAAALPASPEDDSQRLKLLKPMAWVGFGVGGVGLLTSGVFALIADGKSDGCPDGNCKSREAESAYMTPRTVSMVAFYGGAAFAVGGLVAWLLAPDDAAQTRVAIGPGGVSLSGSF